MTESYFLNVMITILLVLGVCCIITLHLEAIRTVFQSFCAIFFVPIQRIYNYLRSVAQRIRTWIVGQLKTECREPNDSPVNFMIGALLYTVLTIVFAYCDFGMIVLTLSAWGMEPPKFQLPDTSTMTAAAIILISLFWGSVYADAAGWTHLTPYIKHSSISSKRIIRWLSVGVVISCMVMGASMAVWRQDRLMKNVSPLEVNEASAGQENLITVDQPLGVDNKSADNGLKVEDDSVLKNSNKDEYREMMDKISNIIFITVPAGITALCFISTFFSGVNGHYLLNYILTVVIALGAAVIILPSIFLSWITATLLDVIFSFFRALLDLLASLGASFLRLFGWRPENGTANQPILAPAGNAIPPASGPAPTDNTNDYRAGQAVNNGARAAEQRPEEINSRPTDIRSNNDVGFNPFSRRL